MKIKIGTIIGAIPALRKLNELDLPLTKCFEVFGLVGAADKALAFFTEKREIIQKKADSRDKELDELVNREIELDAEKISITISDDLRLSAADIGQLVPFVDFEASEKNERR